MVFQFSYRGKAVHRVSGKSADRLGDDQIDFAFQCRFHHVVKAVTLFDGCSRDSLIREHSNKIPVLSALDVIGVVFDLCIIAVLLFLMVCADSGVGGNPALFLLHLLGSIAWLGSRNRSYYWHIVFSFRFLVI